MTPNHWEFVSNTKSAERSANITLRCNVLLEMQKDDQYKNLNNRIGSHVFTYYRYQFVYMAYMFLTTDYGVLSGVFYEVLKTNWWFKHQIWYYDTIHHRVRDSYFTLFLSLSRFQPIKVY